MKPVTGDLNLNINKKKPDRTQTTLFQLIHEHPLLFAHVDCANNNGSCIFMQVYLMNYFIFTCRYVDRVFTPIMGSLAIPFINQVYCLNGRSSYNFEHFQLT